MQKPFSDEATFRPGFPISPEPYLCGPRDTHPAYLSNGVIGITSGEDPFQQAHCIVNSHQKPHPTGHYETQAYCPYPLGLEIRFDGSEYSTPYRFEASSISYDFGAGELTTKGALVCDRGRFSCEVTAFCSRSLPNIVAQRVIVDADVKLVPIIHTRAADGQLVRWCEGTALWEAPGGSRLGVGTAGVETATGLGQFGCLVPEAMHPSPEVQANRLLWLAVDRGFDRLREENRAAWTELWSKRVQAPYPDGQAALDSAFFYLNTSIHPASPNSTGLLGLCPPDRYHNFNNHLFWDLELHALPALLHTQPEAARAMLEARFRGLRAAQSNAAMNGCLGAQFPWEAGVQGQEELPLSASKMLMEQHITPCVGHAFALAAEALGDAFARERAWPVLSEVARWIVSRCEWDADGAHIRRVIGITEGANIHDDNVWLNAVAKKALMQASSMRERMGCGRSSDWEHVAAQIVLPSRNGALIAHPQFQQGDDFCPEELMVLFPLALELPESLRSATLEAGLRRAPESMGWPMHSAYHWIWALMAGDLGHTRRAFEQGVISFMFQPFNLIDEFGEPLALQKRRVGPYLAHCGAMLTTAIKGKELARSLETSQG